MLIYSNNSNLFHRGLASTNTSKKARFPLAAYIKEKHRKEKELITQKLNLDASLSRKLEEIEQRKEEINSLNNCIHAAEERIRRKRKRVSNIRMLCV